MKAMTSGMLISPRGGERGGGEKASSPRGTVRSAQEAVSLLERPNPLMSSSSSSSSSVPPSGSSLSSSSGALPRLDTSARRRGDSRSSSDKARLVSSLPLENALFQHDMRKSDPARTSASAVDAAGTGGGGLASPGSGRTAKAPGSSSEGSMISPTASSGSSPARASSPVLLSPTESSRTAAAAAAAAATATTAALSSEVAHSGNPLSPHMAQKPMVQRQESREIIGTRGSLSLFPGRSLLKGEDGTLGRLGRKGSVSMAPLDDATRLRMEGDTLVKKKRPVDAIEFFNRSLAIDAENPATLVSRAVAHLKTENFVAAVVDCDAAIGFDPVCGAAFARKAKALLALQRFDEAAESFEKARAIDPKLPELKKMNLTDMRNLRQTLKQKNSTSNLRAIVTPRGTNTGDVSLGQMYPKLTGVFAVSLEDLMAAQKQSHPDLLVPEVLPYLIDLLNSTGGLKSEGIFRLSIASNELQTHLGKLAAGRRDLETKDPNVCAVILKHFFRHLPEPLCPDFAACMAVCNDYALHDTSASLRRRKEMQSPLLALFSESTVALLEDVWSRSMSEHARQAAKLLFRLFNTLLLTEKATKMSLDNLALVFVNGVLRDPDPSAMSALASQPSCQRFVTHLFFFVIESKCGEERLLKFPLMQKEELVSPAPPLLSRSSTDEVNEKKKKISCFYYYFFF